MDENEPNDAPRLMTLPEAFERQHEQTEAYIAETLRAVEQLLRAAIGARQIH